MHSHALGRIERYRFRVRETDTRKNAYELAELRVIPRTMKFDTAIVSCPTGVTKVWLNSLQRRAADVVARAHRVNNG